MSKIGEVIKQKIAVLEEEAAIFLERIELIRKGEFEPAKILGDLCVLDMVNSQLGKRENEIAYLKELLEEGGE